MRRKRKINTVELSWKRQSLGWGKVYGDGAASLGILHHFVLVRYMTH